MLTYPKPPSEAVILGAARALMGLGDDVSVESVLRVAVEVRAQGARRAAEIEAGIIAQFSPVKVGMAEITGDEDRLPVSKLAQAEATAPASILDQLVKRDRLPEPEMDTPASLLAAHGVVVVAPDAVGDSLIIDGVRSVEQAVVASLAQVAVAGRDAQRRLLAMVAEKLNELERQLAVGL